MVGGVSVSEITIGVVQIELGQYKAIELLDPGQRQQASKDIRIAHPHELEQRGARFHRLQTGAEPGQP
jgi:hypothetical protein